MSIPHQPLNKGLEQVAQYIKSEKILLITVTDTTHVTYSIQRPQKYRP